MNNSAEPAPASEMVERVALVIATHPDGGNITPGSSLLTRNNVSQWDDLARAAIAAMREPTEAMFDAGMAELKEEPSRLNADDQHVADIWRARSRARKDKSWVLWEFLPCRVGLGRWWRRGRYRTQAEAQAVATRETRVNAERTWLSLKPIYDVRRDSESKPQ
jgi:hypothetical protein